MKRTMKRVLSSLLCFPLAIGYASLSQAAEATSPVGSKITFDLSKVDEQARIQELATSGKQKLCFSKDGKSDFVIVYPDNCSTQLRFAVETLQSIIKAMTGAGIPALPASKLDPKNANLILLDTAGGTRPSSAEAGRDGYRTVISEHGIAITGSSEGGTCNGVYGFLEDTLGCVFATPTETYIPSQPTIWLRKSENIQKPSLSWRDVYAYEAAENHWADRLRLNGIDTFHQEKDSLETKQYAGWGTWCHNCYSFLSPEDYFESHPEYFSYSKEEKKRVHNYDGRDAYLCLSNPEVFEIVKASMELKMKDNPDAIYWDFSGSDNPSLAGCECEECQKLDEAAGGTGMGTLLPFLNKLARAFPDKYISTLAYLHTLKAPVNIKAETNVVIKLCSMPGDQASSYAAGKTPGALQFQEQVKQWNSVTDHIVIWDYVVNFQNLLLPFPNFAVQAENQKFYEKHHVDGVFHQASREIGGEFASLRAYLLSRLLWEGSEMDVAKTVSRYLSVYYGAAAVHIASYMNETAGALYDSGKPLGLYDWLTPHYEGYLSEAHIQNYSALLAKAEHAVQNDTALLSRVRQAKIPVLYAKTLLPDLSPKERTAALTEMSALCKQLGITMVCEWDSLENYQKSGMKKAVSASRKTIYHGWYVACYVAAGVAGAAAAAGTVFLLYRHYKKRKL